MTGTDSLSDFFDDRWEQTRRSHFFYLGTREYADFNSSSKHWVVKGHRGTGKTTLFRALHWRERLANQQLMRELGNNPFSDQTSGCFLQLKIFPVSLLDNWLAGSNPVTQHEVIGAYMRAAWLQDALVAASRLNEKFRFATLNAEVNAFDEVARDFWDWAPVAELGLPRPPAQAPLTLADMLTLASRLLDSLVEEATLGVRTPERVMSSHGLFKFNRMGNALFRCLASYLALFGGDTPWTIRVCLDEGEFLSPNWTRSVRQLIRECDAPLLLAISVLEDFGAETLAEGTEISSDDRRVLDLDKRTHLEFQRLIEGVLGARIREREIDTGAFSLSRLLGDFDVNDLYMITARSSERVSKSAEGYRRLGEKWKAKESPIGPVEQFMLDMGAIKTPPSKSVSRLYSSSGYRKKKVGGYLALVDSLNFQEARYAGWRVALHMADNSVRDFFRFLRALYGEWAEDQRRAVSVTEFLRAAPVPALIQDSALAKVGATKMESLPERIADGARAGNLIYFLAYLTHHLDSEVGFLKSPNAGWFTVSLADFGRIFPSDDLADGFVNIVRQCVRYGYLSGVTIDKRAARLRGRVNTSLARHFGFSYWTPQYTTGLPVEIVRDVLYARSPRQVQGAARAFSDELLERRRPGSPRGVMLDIPGLDPA